MGKHRIIDTDTHVIEPPDTWTSRLPKAWGDDVLHVRWHEPAQQEFWFFGDNPVKSAWRMAMWGFEGRGETYDGSGPSTQADAHPATWDVKRRVELMDELGVDIHVLYPNLAGFDWAPFVHHPNPELSAAHISAYNDLQLDWVREFPRRFVPMMVVPYWDMARTLDEIERNADAGFGGIVFTAVPHEHDQPALSSRHWYPMWRACEDAGLSVSFHTTSGDFRAESQKTRASGDVVTGGASIARGGTKTYLDNGKAVVDLLMSGILPRFPNLKFTSVESGIGWAPFILEALDKRFIDTGVARSNPEYGDLLPSDLFKRQVSVNFWFEELQPYHVDGMGLASLLWESDFPHAQGNLVQANLDEHYDDILRNYGDDVRDEILWNNPARLYAAALDKQGIDHPEVVRHAPPAIDPLTEQVEATDGWRRPAGTL